MRSEFSVTPSRRTPVRSNRLTESIEEVSTVKCKNKIHKRYICSDKYCKTIKLLTKMTNCAKMSTEKMFFPHFIK